MVSILGAGGAIGNELAKELAARNEPFRLVSRNPKAVAGAAETLAADLSRLDDTVKAVSGCSVAFLVVGLKYDTKIWRELWPRIMRNSIEASKRANAKLIFFDNVYMYGKVDGPMTEESPFRPCSRKGEIRAEIATTLLDEIKAGSLTALIARAADFYGPGIRSGVPNVLVFDKLAKGQTPSWLANDSVKHSFTYTPDAARSLIQLMDSGSAWNQTWHVPTAPDPPTGKEFIALAAKEFGATPETSRSQPPDGQDRRLVRFGHSRILRDALPERVRLRIRFLEIRQSVPLPADVLRRGYPQSRRSQPAIDNRCWVYAVGHTTAHDPARV